MGAAGFGSRPRQAAATEGLHANHGADHIPVDVNIAGAYPPADVLRLLFNPTLYAQREAVTQVVDLLQQWRQFSGVIAQHV